MKERRRRKWKKRMAGLMCSCLLVGLFPTVSLADNATNDGSNGLDLSGVTSNATYTCGVGTAEWTYSADPSATPHQLKLSGDGIIGAQAGKAGIKVPDSDEVEITVSGHWTVTGGTPEKEFSGAHGINAGNLKLMIEQNGSLKTVGGSGGSHSSCYGISAKELTVVNDGELIAQSPGEHSQYGIGCTKNFTLTGSGSGTALVQGGAALSVGNGMSNTALSVTIESGTLTVESGKYGISLEGGIQDNVFTIKNGATVHASGTEYGIWAENFEVNIEEGAMGTVKNGFLALTTIGAGNQGKDYAYANNASSDRFSIEGLRGNYRLEHNAVSDLNLAAVTGNTFFSKVGSGTATWNPSKGANSYDNPNQLTLSDVTIANTSGPGITLPQGYNRLNLSGDNQAEGSDYGIYVADHTGSNGGSQLDIYGASSLIAQGGTEAMHVCNNSYDQNTDTQRMSVTLHGPSVTGMALTAEVGTSAAVTKGLPNTAVVNDYDMVYLPEGIQYLNMAYVTPGVNEYPLTVERGWGGGVYASGAAVTITSDRADFKQWYFDDGNKMLPLGQAGVTFLGGTTDQSETVQFVMPAEALVVQATSGSEDPSPPPSSSRSRSSTYAVVYKSNYSGGSADVRDSGYRSGATVTVKGSDLFKAPQDKEFTGWAESASGAVKYKAGDTFKMPAQTQTLYAVWKGKTEGNSGPTLNKTDHMAYIEGYPDGNVGPLDYITREQTAAIFYRLLDSESRSRYHSTSSPFPDVANNRWSAEAVATMAKAGILKGLPDGTFAPKASITRGEFAAIAARFDSEGYHGSDLFPDISGHWAADLINRAAQKGWVKGDADGLFRAGDPITRAEAAALINRVLERAPETPNDLLSGMKTFPDNLDESRWYYLDIQEAANGHDYKRKPDGVHEAWTELKAN